MSAPCLATPALTDAPTQTVVTCVVAPGASTEQDRGKTETSNPTPLSQNHLNVNFNNLKDSVL